MTTAWTDQQLLAEYKNISVLESISSLLSWDYEAMMPAGSEGLRQVQSATLEKLSFERFTSPHYAEAVLESTSNDPQILRLKKMMAEALAFDSDFVSNKVEVTMKCQSAWKGARESGNFSEVESQLSEVVKMAREGVSRLRASKHLKDTFSGKSDYEILLDQYDPGLPAEKLRSMLGTLSDKLKEKIPLILEKQKAKQSERERVLPLLKMSISKQKEIVEQVVGDLGFNFKKGRLDTSTHPFCGGSPDDVRMTTRFRGNDFTDSLSGGIHETGHALYNFGLPESLRFTPCGGTDSFGIHESQSRLYENNLGRSIPFLRYLSKRLDLPAEDLNLLMNWVQPSYIRVDADEVTYNLHIAMRMGIEQDLIEGKIEVRDLPELWRSKFKELFGLEIESDSQGCLQDIHWYFGAFGYFPSYSVGNILAAQLFENFSNEHSSWGSEAECGDFANLLTHLRDKVHSLASIDDTPTRIHKMLGGQEFKIDSFVNYIDLKYLG